MNNYCLTMWAEEPIICSECGKDIGWEKVSIEQTPVKVATELLRRDIGIKEGETTEITLSDREIDDIRIYFEEQHSWHTFDIYRMYDYKMTHPGSRIRARVTSVKMELVERPDFDRIHKSILIICSILGILFVALKAERICFILAYGVLTGSIAFRMFLKCISTIKESKNVLLFGGERLTLCVDKKLKCDYCGCEINHQYDHKHSITWTSDPEMKLIKQKINKISKTKCEYGMLDRRNEHKLLSCEDMEDIIKLQQYFSKKERIKNAEALKDIKDMINNNECSAYLVFDEDISEFEKR